MLDWSEDMQTCITDTPRKQIFKRCVFDGMVMINGGKEKPSPYRIDVLEWVSSISVLYQS